MVTLYLEGGGNRNARLERDCRSAFRQLLARAGFQDRLPKIVACGGRGRAFERLSYALDAGETALLLVDSEEPVSTKSPWDHIRQRKGDESVVKPTGAKDGHLHLMVQVMESWFLADRAALRKFYGAQFQESALPKNESIEAVTKKDLYDGLEKATKPTKTKGPYGKGTHSFKVLATLDPKLVRAASPWADRFFKALDTLLA